MRIPTVRQLERLHRAVVGPWQCEECKALAQFAEVQHGVNHIYCRNCGFERIIDKRHSLIVENDGTFWKWDADGVKTQVRGQ